MNTEFFSLFNAGSSALLLRSQPALTLFVTVLVIVLAITGAVTARASEGLDYSAAGELFYSVNKNIQNLPSGFNPIPRHRVMNLDVIFGWPRPLSGEVPFLGRCPTVLDFDMNHDWEFSVLTVDNRLNVFQNDGANYPGFPLDAYQGNRAQPWVNSRHNATSAAGDITGNGLPELVYISDIGYLHVIGEDYNEPEPFPVDIGRNMETGVPVISDIDGNGDLDILFNVWSLDPDRVDEQSWMYVYDNTGRDLRGWPIPYPNASSSSPAAGDINGDGDVEVVIGNSSRLDEAAHIWAWRPDGILVEGFPTGAFQTIHGAPTLADLNGNGNLEIIVWAASFEGDEAGIFAFDGSGNLLDGYPLSCPTGHPEGSPVIADINSDGEGEIVFGTFSQEEGGRIYAWTFQGDILENFPLQLNSSVIGSLLLADVSGDGEPDIISAMAPIGESDGELIAFNSSGDIVDDFPISLEDYEGGAFAWMPTIWDIDHDSNLDIIGITTDRRVFVWSTPGQITSDVWLTYKGDMKRSGMRPADNPNDIPWRSENNTPQSSIVIAYPNPFNSVTQISLNLSPGNQTVVTVYDLTGSLVTSAILTGESGSVNKYVFDAREYSLSAGIYLFHWESSQYSGTMRLLYMP